MPPAPILVTGAAGFIGYHVAARLLTDGHAVTGVDNLSPYYDVQLKHARLDRLRRHPRFQFLQADVADAPGLEPAFATRPEIVIHLAAQAGVRHSLQHPESYIAANLVGFANILERCRRDGVGHLVYASTSSVYGANTRLPFSVHDRTDHPLSLYAATKRSNELMAHTYAHLFGLPVTGLRFFTVYGPWGRPDMSYFLFTKAILAGSPITLFNGGEMDRDFTYIDDVVEAVVRIAARPAEPDPAWNPAEPDPATSSAPYRLYNIGNHRPVRMREVVRVLERCIGRPAVIHGAPMQPGDVTATCADVAELRAAVGFEPRTSIEDGLARFVEWYRAQYGDEAG